MVIDFSKKKYEKSVLFPANLPSVAPGSSCVSTGLSSGYVLPHSYGKTISGWEWLALVRRAWVEGIPEAGNQLWVMRPDGTEANQYTDEEKHTFGQPSWSSDSRYLLFDYRAVEDGQINSGIKILDLKTGRISDLIAPGSRPAWLE